MNEPKRPASDAEWYCRKTRRQNGFMKFSLKCAANTMSDGAAPARKSAAFIEEVTRVTYELDRAARLGSPTDSVRPTFAS